MLTKVTAYGPLPSVPALVFNLVNIPDSDLYQMRNIDGLGPVKANVNTTPSASVKGESYSGSTVGKRNILFTIGLISDWQSWTPATLRKNLESYFSTGQDLTLIFESDERPPVVISGYVESNDPNIFSKDPENVVSIICPQPDFVTVDPFVVTGDTTTYPVTIDYHGTVEAGLLLEITGTDAGSPTLVHVDLTPDGITPVIPFDVQTFTEVTGPILDGTKDFSMSSIPRQKYVKNIAHADSAETDIIGWITPGSIWPKFQPGNNIANIYTNHTSPFDWRLTYYERYGSL